ncbi:CheR family methyltransferase [Ramlibacter sp. MAHUQ-53]|uniref:CheR family methyltransferase n=1 Tax=unclassified Ramlibacter TaxID=2617605 RepID=UPI0036445120
MAEAAALRPGEREIAFSPADFQRVRAMIRARAGIDLHPGKQNMVYSRLARRLRDRGHATFTAYLDSLRGDHDPEWQEFINCLTTNLTSFFREPHHFEHLARHLKSLPAAGGAVRIWSCAASTGEEPYSIAMTALECAGSAPRVTIDASDIDTRVLGVARDGVYPLDTVAGVGEARLRRFFLKGSGANAGKARAKPELQALLSFRPLNLLTPQWQAPSPYDVIFCRNVMIYFDRPTQRQVLERLCGSLKPGGILYVGHSENFTEHRDLVELVGKTTYRRIGGAA